MAKATKAATTTDEVTTEVTEPVVTVMETAVEDAPPVADPEDAFGPIVEPQHAPVPQITQTENFLSVSTLAEMQRGRESIARR